MKTFDLRHFLFILVLFLTIPIVSCAQNTKKEKVEQIIETNSRTFMNQGVKQVIIKDSKGIKVRTERLREKTYTYEIKRNGRVIETGTVEMNTNERKIKTRDKDGKVLRNRNF